MRINSRSFCTRSRAVLGVILLIGLLGGATSGSAAEDGEDGPISPEQARKLLTAVSRLEATVTQQQSQISQLQSQVRSLSATPATTAVEQDLNELRASQELQAEEFHAQQEESKAATRVYGQVNSSYNLTGQPGVHSSFRLDELSVATSARLASHWSAWTEVEFSDDGSVTPGGLGLGEIEVDRAYVQYSKSPELVFKVGKIFTPWGLWNKTDWKSRLPTRTQPIAVATELLPENVLGLHISGQTPLGKNSGDRLQYAFSVFNDKGENVDGTDPNNNKWILGDLNVAFKSGWIAGATAATGRNAIHEDRKEVVGVLYGRGFLDRHDRLELWTELTNLTSEPRNVFDAWAQLQWEFTSNWRMLFRYEQSNHDETAGLGDGRRQIVFGVNDRPNEKTILSLEIVRDEFDTPAVPDYYTAILRVGAVFGAL